MRRGARTWVEGLAREPTGADASTQRCCKEFTGGAGAPAGGSGWGLGASSHRPVLTEPLHPPPLPAWGDSAQAELGDPGLGRAAAGSCARGGPTGLGGTPAVSPRGEGSRERQEGPPSGKPKCLAEAQERPHVRRLSPQGEVRAAGLVSERPALRAAGGALGSQGQSL